MRKPEMQKAFQFETISVSDLKHSPISKNNFIRVK